MTLFSRWKNFSISNRSLKGNELWRVYYFVETNVIQVFFFSINFMKINKFSCSVFFHFQTMEDFETVHGALHQYSFMFPFEKNYVTSYGRQWMEKHWHLSFYFSAVYVAVIFGLKYLMTNSKPFSLRPLLVAWNASLAAISIVMFCRTLPEFMHTLSNFGIYNSVCTSRWDFKLGVKFPIATSFFNDAFLWVDFSFLSIHSMNNSRQFLGLPKNLRGFHFKVSFFSILVFWVVRPEN